MLSKRPDSRPDSLREVVSRARGGEDFGMAFAEFLDHIKNASVEDIDKSIAEEPGLLDVDWQNAWIGGSAEHLARLNDTEIPAWAERPERFLRKAWFSNSGLTSLNAILLVESPLAFRRRFIFTEAKPFRRA